MRGTRTNIVAPVLGTPDAAATTSALALRRAARRSAGSGDPSVAASLRLRSRRLRCAIAARRTESMLTRSTPGGGALRSTAGATEREKLGIHALLAATVVEATEPVSTMKLNPVVADALVPPLEIVSR